MPLNKIGVTQKIKTVATSEQEFERMKDQIIASNKLARCNRCGKLLAKLDSGLASVKRKDVDLIVQAENMMIKCPVCQTCNMIDPKK